MAQGKKESPTLCCMQNARFVKRNWRKQLHTLKYSTKHFWPPKWIWISACGGYFGVLKLVDVQMFETHGICILRQCLWGEGYFRSWLPPPSTTLCKKNDITGSISLYAIHSDHKISKDNSKVCCACRYIFLGQTAFPIWHYRNFSRVHHRSKRAYKMDI